MPWHGEEPRANKCVCFCPRSKYQPRSKYESPNSGEPPCCCRRTEMASSSVMTTASQVIATSKHDHQLSCATRINSQPRRRRRRRRTAGEGLMCVTQDERAKNDSKWRTHTLTHKHAHTLLYRAGLRRGDGGRFGGGGWGGTMWQCVTSPPDKVSKQQRKHG